MVQTMLIQFYCTLVSSGSGGRPLQMEHSILHIAHQIFNNANWLNALQKSRPSYVWGVAFLKPTISIVATPPQWEKWDIVDIKCDPITHTLASDAALDVTFCRGPIIHTALGLICRNLHLGCWTISETDNWHDLIIFWNWQLTSAI